MKNNHYSYYFIMVSLVSLLLGMLCGLLAGFQYVVPDFIKSVLPFDVLRPLHTLFVVSWILLSAVGCIYYYLNLTVAQRKVNSKLVPLHFWIFILTGIGITISFLSGKFGGKEYLEFPFYFYFPIMLGWILFGMTFFKTAIPTFKTWPVYYWMWATGIVFMVYHFTEAHLWLLPYFKGHFIQNMALQWKAGGSYVGSWNMLVYGTSLYVMSKISGDELYAKSGKAFFFYFLGLTNLMFGWAHHIYIIPTAAWIRYLAYAISMTEWIILFSILHDWKKSLSDKKIIKYKLAYRFMRLSNFWLLLNIILALLISIPSINLFTHGTHITVAHSMGTTIGINTLILLSSLTFILESIKPLTQKENYSIGIGIRIFHISFLVFWIILLLMGVKKSYWFFTDTTSFGTLQSSLHWYYMIFTLAGLGIVIGLGSVCLKLIKQFKNIGNI